MAVPETIELVLPLLEVIKDKDEYKLIEITDEESLNKENLSIESSNEDLTNIVSKITNLKDKIGKEIIK